MRNVLEGESTFKLVAVTVREVGYASKFIKSRHFTFCRRHEARPEQARPGR